MKTTENNKLIAEFIGYVLRGKNTYEYNDKLYFSDELKFHNDWNRLMEVVKKCRQKQVSNMPVNIMADIYDALHNCEIEHLYNAVVEFIKWYNLSKK